MTVTLELKPEVEAHLVAQAKAQNVSVEEYIQGLLESLAGTESTFNTRTPEERAKAWEKWVAGHGAGIPVILDDSREAIYEDDGR